MGIDGILNINKPADMTSHDVVAVVRRSLGIKKVGHTGTLDPMATGVLPVCIGKGTRIIEYLDMDQKKYRCTMVLGRRMDTEDIWGSEIDRAPEEAVNAVTEEQIRSAFAPISGIVHQTPPIYSAIKVKGKKLYEYAREGRSVEIPGRDIYIEHIELEEIRTGMGYDSSITFTVTCSKGTYVRAICEDVGLALGVYGAMSSLSRLASGCFRIEDALELSELGDWDDETLQQHLIRPEEPLGAFGELEIRGKDIWRMCNGLSFWTVNAEILREPEYSGTEPPIPVRDEFRRAYCVYGRTGESRDFLGVAFMDTEGRNLKADKVFFTGRTDN